MTGTRVSRRRFLRSTTAASVAAGLAPAFIRNLRAASPNGVQRHAAVGAAGVATSDIDRLTAAGNNVKLVAVADVDLNRLLEVDLEGRFPDVRIYQDYREMLEKEKDLDSVSVSTPDHTHAPIALTAMQRGLNVYVQKPMSYTVHEARVLTEYAAKNPKLVTQMGIQNHQLQHHRVVVKLRRRHRKGQAGLQLVQPAVGRHRAAARPR
jgi:predicted dehydrogenase